MSSRGRIPVAKEGELYSLKWQTYQGHISSGLQRLYTSNDTESLRDVTLGSEGQYVKAHKVILSLCSPYFRLLFQTNKAENGNMIIILEHLKFRDLKNVIHFIYNGEIKVKNSDLKGFLRAGELLQIEGLAKGNSEDNDDDEVSPPPTKSRRAGSTGATSFAGGSASFLPQPSSSKSSTTASTMVHPVMTSKASTAVTPSSSSTQTVKRSRLGRVIKPKVRVIDYDYSNCSLEEEVETERLALDSAVVTLQENDRLNTITSTEQRNDGEVLTRGIKTEIPSDFFAIDSDEMDTGLMITDSGDGNKSDSGDSNGKLSAVSQDQDSMTSSFFSNDVEIIATYDTPPTPTDVSCTGSATGTASSVFLEIGTKKNGHASSKTRKPFDRIWGLYDTIKDSNGKILSNKCKACSKSVSAQAQRMRRHLEKTCTKTTFTNNG